MARVVYGGSFNDGDTTWPGTGDATWDGASFAAASPPLPATWKVWAGSYNWTVAEDTPWGYPPPTRGDGSPLVGTAYLIWFPEPFATIPSVETIPESAGDPIAATTARMTVAHIPGVGSVSAMDTRFVLILNALLESGVVSNGDYDFEFLCTSPDDAASAAPAFIAGATSVLHKGPRG